MSASLLPVILGAVTVAGLAFAIRRRTSGRVKLATALWLAALTLASIAAGPANAGSRPLKTGFLDDVYLRADAENRQQVAL